MIPRPGEPQALKKIEERLAQSDPGLAAMLTRLDADPGRTRQRARRARARHAAVMVVLGMLFCFCVTMAAITFP